MTNPFGSLVPVIILVEWLSSSTHRHGLVLPTGHCPSVGLTGITLVGGQGPLSRLYGLTSDFVKAVEYVDEKGNVVLATEDNEHSSALWLARGGSGRMPFPGIITSWHFHRLPEVETRNEAETIWTEIEVYWKPTLENAQAVLSGWQDMFLDKELMRDPLANRFTVEAWIALYPNRKTGRFEKIIKLTTFFYGPEDLHMEAAKRLYPRLEQVAGPNTKFLFYKTRR
jgi:FAD/FMN-containing dehydrogenase